MSDKIKEKRRYGRRVKGIYVMLTKGTERYAIGPFEDFGEAFEWEENFLNDYTDNDMFDVTGTISGCSSIDRDIIVLRPDCEAFKCEQDFANWWYAQYAQNPTT